MISPGVKKMAENNNYTIRGLIKYVVNVLKLELGKLLNHISKE